MTVQYTSPARYANRSRTRSYIHPPRVQVAIVLQGRQAGKKVVVIKQLDEGTNARKFPHAIVAGIERYPRKVTRRMGQKKLALRSKVKPFIKVRWTLGLLALPMSEILIT
jgi:ribosomal protein L14E/L6E/L27E